MTALRLARRIAGYILAKVVHFSLLLAVRSPPYACATLLHVHRRAFLVVSLKSLGCSRICMQVCTRLCRARRAGQVSAVQCYLILQASSRSIPQVYFQLGLPRPSCPRSESTRLVDTHAGPCIDWSERIDKVDEHRATQAQACFRPASHH